VNRGRIIGAAIAALVVLVPAVAQGSDDTPSPDNTIAPAVSTTEPSPTTTSEFGTETEIVIALDENSNVVPG
jgi:hypothetical protein